MCGVWISATVLTELQCKIFPQGITPDFFEGTVSFLGLIVLAPTGGVTQINPVGRAIARALELLRVNEGLQQINRMSIELLPIRRDDPSHSPQQMAGQVRHLGGPR